MTDRIKVALILAAAILIAVGAYIYFSPYQSCLRDLRGKFNDQKVPLIESVIKQMCSQQGSGN